LKRLKLVLVEMRLPLVYFGTLVALVVYDVASGTTLEEELGLLLFVLIFNVVMGVFFIVCYRQYSRARRKGYHPVIAIVIIFGVTFGATIVQIIVTMITGLNWTEDWSNSAENAFIFLYVLGVPLLASAAVVAALPRRDTRRAGPRPEPWPPLEDSKFARTLEAAVEHDPRPPVLYLRAFYQESSAFAWGLKTAMARYVHNEKLRDSNVPVYGATFEQYLGATLTQGIGPFVALGNPDDPGSPEGAARLYAEDRDWQQEFLGLAESAAAIVMDLSSSKNLSWELATLRSHNWQCKLFVITPPGPKAKLAVLSAVNYAAKSIPARHWDEFLIQLAHAGFQVDSVEVGPGSIVSFNMAGQAEILTSGAREPEEFTKAIRTRLETLT
jgi:hypothetical protein